MTMEISVRRLAFAASCLTVLATAHRTKAGKNVAGRYLYCQEGKMERMDLCSAHRDAQSKVLLCGMKDDRDPITGKLLWAPGEKAAFRAKEKAKKMAARAERDALIAQEKAERDARLADRYAAQKPQDRPPERAWVQTALKARGRTLTELAEAWDVSPPTITKWLDGSVSMTALTLERAVSLADMLGIDLTELARRLGLNPPEISAPQPRAVSARRPSEPVFGVERTNKGYRVRVDALVTGPAGAALAKAVLTAADDKISWDEN